LTSENLSAKFCTFGAYQSLIFLWERLAAKKMTTFSRFVIIAALFVVSTTSAGFFQVRSQRRPELIRDTEKSEETEEETEVEKPKEYNPLLASQNLKVGNYYFKKKNYDAAIQRYLDAIGFQPGLSDAYEALARAYERNGSLSKAIEVFKEFIRKNPESPKVAEFQAQADKLQKKQPAPAN
jgi:pentatricopeptide repeat protein